MQIYYSHNKLKMKIANVWGATSDWKQSVKGSIAEVHGCPTENSLAPYEAKPQNTLITHLSDNTTDIIFSNISSKTFKYHIKRNLKDDVEVFVLTPEKLMQEQEVISAFRSTYHNMYKEKGVETFLSDEDLLPAIQQKVVYLSYATINGSPTVFHSYINTGNGVRLWHSCSCFRGNEEMRNIIGRTNKRLHWDDIVYFKGLGFEEYDWGGIFSFEAPNGIDTFKLSFGGERRTYYNGVVPLNLIGKLFLKTRKILKI